MDVIEKIAGEVLGLSLSDEAKADMLAEVVVEHERLVGLGVSGEDLVRRIWAAAWGARYRCRTLGRPLHVSGYMLSKNKPVEGEAYEPLVETIDITMEGILGDKGVVWDDAVEWSDCFERLSRSVKDMIDVEIIKYRMEDKTYADIGALLGMSDAGVIRRIRAIRERYKDVV